MMNKYLTIIVGIACLAISLSCKQEAGKVTENGKVQNEINEIKDIKATEALALMQALENDYIILDVRTPDEIAEGKIADAKEIDFNGKGFENKLAALDKDAKYIVYCRSGGRSGRTMKKMQEMGFTTVYNVEGGIGALNKAMK